METRMRDIVLFPLFGAFVWAPRPLVCLALCLRGRQGPLRSAQRPGRVRTSRMAAIEKVRLRAQRRRALRKDDACACLDAQPDFYCL
jgi:hypothetical protein